MFVQLYCKLWSFVMRYVLQRELGIRLSVVSFMCLCVSSSKKENLLTRKENFCIIEFC